MAISPDNTPQSIITAFCAPLDALGWYRLADPVADGGSAVEMRVGYTLRVSGGRAPTRFATDYRRLIGTYAVEVWIYRARCINTDEMWDNLLLPEDAAMKAIDTAIGPHVAAAPFVAAYMGFSWPVLFGEHHKIVQRWQVAPASRATEA